MLPQGTKVALEHISGRVVAPGATLTPVTPTGTDSFQIKGSIDRAFICGAWNKQQAAGKTQITSQRMHDNKNGFAYDTITGDPYSYWSEGSMQEVFAQDNIAVNVSGSAVAGDFELFCMLNFYTNAKGMDMNMIDEAELWRRKVYDVTITNTITGVATGAYAEQAISSGTIYNLTGNTQYAILGFLINTPCASVVYRGPDFSYVRTGLPANSANKQVSREGFVRLSRIMGLPTIPVFNSANGPATTVGVLSDENGGTFIVNTILCQLR